MHSSQGLEVQSGARYRIPSSRGTHYTTVPSPCLLLLKAAFILEWCAGAERGPHPLSKELPAVSSANLGPVSVTLPQVFLSPVFVEYMQVFFFLLFCLFFPKKLEHPPTPGLSDIYSVVHSISHHNLLNCSNFSILEGEQWRRGGCREISQ